MSITIKKLSELTGWDLLSGKAEYEDLIQIQLLCGKSQRLDDNILFICSPETLCGMKDTPKNICLTGTPAATFPDDSSVLLPPSGITDEDLYSFLLVLIAEREYVDKCSLALYSALSESKGIPHIMQVGATLFDNPVIFLNHSFRLLGSAAPDDFHSDYYSELCELGCFPTSYIFNEIVHDTVVHNAIFSAESPAPIFYEGSGTSYIPFRVCIGSEPVGFATLMELKKPFRKCDAEVFRVFCSVLGLEAKSSGAGIPSGTRKYDYFIAELLEQTIRPEHIAERLNYFDLHLKQNLYLLVTAQCNEKEYKRYYTKFVREISLNPSYPEAYAPFITVRQLPSYLRTGNRL